MAGRRSWWNDTPLRHCDERSENGRSARAIPNLAIGDCFADARNLQLPPEQKSWTRQSATSIMPTLAANRDSEA